MTSQLCYRGLAYDKASHETPSSRSVDHTYRGHHYQASLLHEVAPSATTAELCYRGHHYVGHRAQPNSQL